MAAHDYVSKFHLRQFCDPESLSSLDPSLWVGDLSDGSVKRRAPKNVGTAPDLFDGPGGLAHPEATVEAYLAIEGTNLDELYYDYTGKSVTNKRHLLLALGSKARVQAIHPTSVPNRRWSTMRDNFRMPDHPAGIVIPTHTPAARQIPLKCAVVPRR